MSSTDTVPVARPAFALNDVALVAVFAGLIAAFSLLPAVPVGALGVPITLQTLAVALTGMVLGPLRGFLATALYLVVGFAGLPVFAGGAAGLGVFAKPSIGYLLSFPLAAALAGFLTYLVLRRKSVRWYVLWGVGLVASIVFVHPLGIVGMSTIAHMPLEKAAIVDLAYWPGDVLKNLAAALVAVQVHRAFPALASQK